MQAADTSAADGHLSYRPQKYVVRRMGIARTNMAASANEPDHRHNRKADQEASKKISRPSMALMHDAPHRVSRRMMASK
jgi:hypothetical protein